MTTKRRPLNRNRRHKISPEAIDAFKRMGAARDGSKAWLQAHHALHAALELPPWVNLDGSEDKPIYPLDRHSERTGDLWRELEAAAGRQGHNPFRPS